MMELLFMFGAVLTGLLFLIIGKRLTGRQVLVLQYLGLTLTQTIYLGWLTGDTVPRWLISISFFVNCFLIYVLPRSAISNVE